MEVIQAFRHIRVTCLSVGITGVFSVTNPLFKGFCVYFVVFSLQYCIILVFR